MRTKVSGEAMLTVLNLTARVEISKILFKKNAETGECYLGKDAKVACQLLAINAADLIPR